MNAKKILSLAGDYVEDYEVMVSFQALQMVGHSVEVVCPDKTAGQQVPTAVHDFTGDQTYSEKPGHNFTLNATFSTIDVKNYDALLLLGGRSPEYLRTDQRVLHMIQHFHTSNKPIAAICHGPQLLAAAGVLKGRTCTAYCTCTPDIEAVGGKYIAVEATGAYRDGNLITAPTWLAHPAWLALLLEALGTRIQL